MVRIGDELDAFGSQGIVRDLFFSFSSFGDASGRDDCYGGLFLAQFQQGLDLCGIVHDGGSIRHGLETGDSAVQGCGGSGGDTFAVFVAGLSEMGVQVKEAGKNEGSAGINERGS